MMSRDSLWLLCKQTWDRSRGTSEVAAALVQVSEEGAQTEGGRRGARGVRR